MGTRGIAFDRNEVDDWWEAHMIANGRPGRQKEGKKLCRPEQKESVSSQTSGLSTSSIEDKECFNASDLPRKKRLSFDSVEGKVKSIRKEKTNFEKAVNDCSLMVRTSI